MSIFDRWETLRRSISAWKTRVELEARRNVFDVSESDSRNVAAVLPDIEEHDAQLKAYFLSRGNRASIEGKVGAATLLRWEADTVAFAPSVANEVSSEANLTNEYFRLIGQLKGYMHGQELTLPQLAAFGENPDRKVRREACAAGWQAFDEQSSLFDAMFDSLVHCRDTMARKLGYDSYVPLAYKKLGRTDYSPADVAALRSEIKQFIVPLAKTLAAEQAEALGVDALMPWDEAFLGESLTTSLPACDKQLIERIRSAAGNFHASFRLFLDAMIQGGCMDLSDRPGKAAGAFCVFLTDIEMPFVVASYTGSSRSAGSIVHELGHAFQNYQSRHQPVLEQIIPTNEIGETQSIAFELLAGPLYENIFGCDSARYHAQRLRFLVGMLPYIAAIDEFQEVVYTTPTASAVDRREMWLQIARHYLPWRNSGGIKALDLGIAWQRQRHVYGFPFYYIDYAIAICCALQLWLESLVDRSAAVEKWLSLCSIGGSMGFKSLLSHTGLQSPFQAGTLSGVVAKIKKLA